MPTFTEVDFNPFENNQPQERTEPSPDRKWSDVPGEAISNLPVDVLDIGKSILEMVKHPINAAKGIDGLVMGAFEKAMPGGTYPHEKYADALTAEIMKRYGSIDALKQTIATEPAKFMMDISAALSGLGKVVQAGGEVSGIGKVAQAGRAINAAGEAVEPFNVAKQAVKAAIPKKLPGRLYQSAAKMPTTMDAAQRAKSAGIALEEGVMPTGSGLDKLRGKIDALNNEITTVIDDATNAGKTIQTDSLFKYLDDLRDDAMLTGTPKTNLNVINRIEDQIRSLGRNSITPAQAQRLKQNIYKEINTAYGKMSVPYRVEAQKAVARAAKEEIESLHPEIKNLNAKEGALIELYDAIARATNRIDNRDLLGIGVPIKGTVGGVAAGPAGVAGGVAAGILDTPRVKAALAIVLNKAKKMKTSSGVARKSTYAASQVQEETQ